MFPFGFICYFYASVLIAMRLRIQCLPMLNEYLSFNLEKSLLYSSEDAFSIPISYV